MLRSAPLFIAIALAVRAVTIAPAAARAAAQTGTATIHGIARSASGEPLAYRIVRLRNLQTGEIVAATTSSALGQFTFTGVNPGSYLIEILNPDGRILAASPAISAPAGSSLTTTVVTPATAAAAAAAARVNTALIVTAAASAAGITGLVVAATKREASPSR